MICRIALMLVCLMSSMTVPAAQARVSDPVVTSDGVKAFLVGRLPYFGAVVPEPAYTFEEAQEACALLGEPGLWELPNRNLIAPALLMAMVAIRMGHAEGVLEIPDPDAVADFIAPEIPFSWIQGEAEVLVVNRGMSPRLSPVSTDALDGAGISPICVKRRDID